MSRVYRALITSCDRFVPIKLRPLWEHEAGPKTVFFWAPAFKWGLVIAGLSDFNRPAEKLSIPQSVSLAATGLIWSRYSLVIIPKNYSLFAVNVFVAITSLYQIASTVFANLSALVAASVEQYRRPLDKISTTQSASLAATGFIWTRYCLVIRPINYSLSICNFMLGLANAVQCGRAFRYQSGMKALAEQQN